ncbi:N-acetyltransferase GCN5 [Agaricicola taiwanensis]|uniref:N-acetyltransferase GCN5 n=1 Tax=Agaricicola taiwanensis TaxID=591372 RepID=A0A8J2YBF4_9RHOB|nr:GNAT family N-acetyltransferase [Agaricicola taiwanensis]GGE27856.1 N-acetyltransferase GCN5 [Agaricicola taiwanensis]
MSIVAIDLRPARVSDAAAIAAVHDAAWRLAYSGLIPGRDLERMVTRRGPSWWDGAIRRGSRIALLTVSGEVVGYGSYGRNRATAIGVGGEIYELYVMPEYQGLGFGRRLFAACREALAERELVGLAVWALSDNESACRFYRALGGVAVARGTETFGDRSLEKLAFAWA